MEAINQALSNLNLGNGEDRISHLPESVLTHILSHLTTKDAMLTSILSRNWRMKWICIYNLHFDDGMLYANEVTNKQIFINFVEKVFHFCGTSRLQSFSLTCSQKYDPFLISEWISTALTCGIQRFCLIYRNGDDLVLPNCFLGCETLEEAKLIIPCILKVSPVTSFKNLKILYVTKVRVENASYPQCSELTFTFPVLEEFSMISITWRNVKVIILEAPRLSSCRIAWCQYKNMNDQLDNCEIKILKACGLTNFNWASNYFLENFVMDMVPSVSKAGLDHIYGIDDFWKVGIGAAKIMKQLSTVRHMELSIDIVEAMELAGVTESLPLFSQIKYLKLESRSSGSTKALMSFLRKIPNLRYLKIYSYFPWKNDDYEMLGTLPPCIMICLEKVYFTYHFGNSIGFHLMKLLLQNAHALELMSICALEIPSSWKTEIKLMLRIVPRASKNAVIEVE
ncbi:hypothetical protein ACH5RR_028062 [Cinchona calisaya]|uniref:F-box domain-containing protein n=1 Tax=Cinchona calisaya TaxID=153742 RepID=A0ABD2YPU3_9GENT